MKTKVFLPFIPLIAPLVSGEIATATARYHRHPFYPSPGQPFQAHCNCRPIEGIYFCTSIKKLALGKISKLYYREIGIEFPFSFEEIWCQICGISQFHSNIRCDYYEFRRIK